MARKCFEYRGYKLQELKGEACAVGKGAEGKRTRHRLGVPIKPETTARTKLIAWVDFQAISAAGGELTVAEIWNLFIADKEEDQKPVESDKYRWKSLGPWFGHLKPSQVSDQMCRNYAKERFKPCVERRRMRNGEYQEIKYTHGRSPDTVWTELVTLQAALSWGLKKGHWTWPNADEFMLWRPARSTPRDRVLTREESERLIDCATGHTKLFIIIGTFTGARKGAILELKWSQVDLDNGVIDFRSTKAIDPMSKHYKKGRATVTMSPTLRAMLVAYKEKARSDYVIEYGGSCVDDIKTGWNAAAKKAGLWSRDMDRRERVTPHVLRHTLATWLDDADVDEARIQSVLGHAPGSKITRQNYIAKRASATRPAIEALENGQPRLKVVK